MDNLTYTDTELGRMASNFELFYKKMNMESDRGAVIVSAALIDEIIVKMLQKRLTPAFNEKEDELLSTGKAVESYAARVHLAYRLGLLRKSGRESLLLIGKLRNGFAHISDVEGFDSDSTQSRIRKLIDLNENFIQATIETGIEANWKDGNVRQISDLVEVLGWRYLAQIVFTAVATGLTLALEQIEPIEPLIETD